MMKLKIIESREPITNEWSVARIAKEYPPPSWEKVFEHAKREIQDVSDFLEEDRISGSGTRFPLNQNLFKIFWLVKLPNVRVVILGQDPYHGIFMGNPQATGIAFSVDRGVPPPSSLQNIYKEIKTSIPEFVYPSHGDLTNWALQGVFLINSCLTVRAGEPASHKRIWDGFIKKVFHAILEVNPNTIFVAWGGSAQKSVKKFIGERATILESAHPSGLSCKKFFGCNHFVEINNLLSKLGSPPIDWNVY